MKKIILIIILIMAIFQMVVLATAIDIGNPAIARPSGVGGGYTLIIKANPANATGKITSIEIWAESTMGGVEVATFVEGSANTFSTRDNVAIGTVTVGAKRTFEVNLDVVEGDYIGFYWSSGSIEATDIATDGGWWRYTGGDAIPCTDQLFTAMTSRVMSLYGTGTTEEEANAIWFGINF